MSMGMGMGGGGTAAWAWVSCGPCDATTRSCSNSCPRGSCVASPRSPGPTARRSGSSWCSSSSTPSSAPPTRSSTGPSSTPGSASTSPDLIVGARPRRRRAGHPRRRLVAVAALGVGPHRRGPHLRHADQGLRAHPEDAHRLLHPHPDRRARVAAEQRRARRPAGVHRHVLVGREQRDRRGHHPGRDVLSVVADHPGRAGAAAGLLWSRPASSAGAWPTSPASPTRSTPR